MNKHHCLTIFSLLSLAAIGAASPTLALGQEVAWRDDYNRARQEAAEKGLPLVVDIGTENCYWCKQLDLRTFKDPSLVAFLNERTVPLRVDARRLPALAEALNIQSYPTIVFAAPDGRILGAQEGFVEAPRLRQEVTAAVGLVVAPDWMLRDYQAAVLAVTQGQPAKALGLLTTVVEDGKDRPVQGKARQLLQDLELQANNRLTDVKGQTERSKATEALKNLVQTYPGTAAAREAAQLLAVRQEEEAAVRSRHARDLLVRAQEDFRTQFIASCLDRCALLVSNYADLPEGIEASRLQSEIMSNPEWMKTASVQMGERLGALYLGLAENCLLKGDGPQAITYLERLVKTFPESRHAETARTRLAQIQSGPTRSVDLKK